MSFWLNNSRNFELVKIPPSINLRAVSFFFKNKYELAMLM